MSRGWRRLGAVDQLLAADASRPAKPVESHIKPGDTILFQGDSITDAGRKRDVADANWQPALGSGYAWFAASQLLVDSRSANLKIFNRGISGNKVYQLAERWQADCLDLKPNVLSILIGVNDFAHALKGDYKGTLEIYENDYRALIKRTKDAASRCAADYLRTVRAESRLGERFVVSALRRLSGRRAADCRGIARAIRALPNDV